MTPDVSSVDSLPIIHLSSFLLVSQVLSLLLGKDSEMLDFLTNYFLSKVVTNLQMWASESDVIKETGLRKYFLEIFYFIVFFQRIYL